MTDGDEKLRKRYRELATEEPSVALDAAIRAAAHRAVAPKRGAQRWAVPVSLAAVLVLAVGVTLRMQQEQPGIETSAPANEYSMPSSTPEAAAKKPAMEAPPPLDDKSVSAIRQAQPAKPVEPRARDQALATAPLEKSKKDQPPAREEDSRMRQDATVAATSPPPPPPPAKEEKRAFAESAERNVATPAAPPAPAAAATTAPVVTEPPIAAAASAPRPQAAPLARVESPSVAGSAAPPAQARAKSAMSADALKEPAKGPLERELDRIIGLRKDGKHAEADEAIAKFRRENPDYRIPEATWEQVKPR